MKTYTFGLMKNYTFSRIDYFNGYALNVIDLTYSILINKGFCIKTDFTKIKNQRSFITLKKFVSIIKL